MCSSGARTSPSLDAKRPASWLVELASHPSRYSALEYFEPAFQIGMTATPLRLDNKDTYAYFGNPLYTYSLKQGIEDGFLAPYRVHRVVSTVDAAGWRPSKGELDRYGREIPDGQYSTKDFERLVSLKARTQAIARNLTDFLKKTDRFGKTIVFCVDQEHAEEMRKALNNCNADIVKENPDYVVRVVSDEGQIGRGYLDRFMDVETLVPTVVTTSQMLTTGVDVPDVPEHRARASHQLDDGLQADHRPWHARARRLRQTVFQYRRLHGQRDAAIRRSGFRR